MFVVFPLLPPLITSPCYLPSSLLLFTFSCRSPHCFSSSPPLVTTPFASPLPPSSANSPRCQLRFIPSLCHLPLLFNLVAYSCRLPDFSLSTSFPFCFVTSPCSLCRFASSHALDTSRRMPPLITQCHLTSSHPTHPFPLSTDHSTIFFT